MEGPISFWGYKEQESNLILPEHDDDDDDDGINETPFLRILWNAVEIHLSGLIGTARHLDMQKIPDNWIFLSK